MKEFILILLSWITTVAYGQGQPRIMNGQPANVGQFPYQAYISDDVTGACGASIIHKRWLLTAAHCGLYVPKAYAIVGTVYKTGFNGTRIGFEKFIPHKGFARKKNRILNDIALIRLEKDLEFDDNVKAVKLAKDESLDYANVLATLSGWGLRNLQDPPPDHLQFASLEVISEKECSKLWRTAIRKKICTSASLFQESNGACCLGDSGSPLVFRNKQIGVASYGAGPCGLFLPDVYTRVASYITWIEKQLQLYSDKLYS